MILQFQFVWISLGASRQSIAVSLSAITGLIKALREANSILQSQDEGAVLVGAPVHMIPCLQKG